MQRALLAPRAAAAWSVAVTPGRAGSAPLAARGPRSPAAELVRLVGAVALVLAVAAAALRGLDAVPGLVTGEPRDVGRAPTVRDAEVALRARLFLPAYFPSSLSWPPRRVRFVRGSPGAVALWLEGRQGGADLFLAQTVAPGAIPPRLLPAVTVLSSSPVALGAASGSISRVVEEGEVKWELRWQRGGRTLLMRSRAGLEDLLRMARSAREVP